MYALYPKSFHLKENKESFSHLFSSYFKLQASVGKLGHHGQGVVAGCDVHVPHLLGSPPLEHPTGSLKPDPSNGGYPATTSCEMFEVISLFLVMHNSHTKLCQKRYGSSEPSAGNQLVALMLERFVFHVTFLIPFVVSSSTCMPRS